MFCLLGILYGSLYSFTFCKISPKNAENGISGILDFKIFRGGILLDPYKAPHFDIKPPPPMRPPPPNCQSPGYATGASKAVVACTDVRRRKRRGC